jgi:hypothetical protein
VGSHQHRSNRKWKGEDSVRKADELKNSADPIEHGR